jgi:hypothetical protein
MLDDFLHCIGRAPPEGRTSLPVPRGILGMPHVIQWQLLALLLKGVGKATATPASIAESIVDRDSESKF